MAERPGERIEGPDVRRIARVARLHTRGADQPVEIGELLRLADFRRVNAERLQNLDVFDEIALQGEDADLHFHSPVGLVGARHFLNQNFLTSMLVLCQPAILEITHWKMPRPYADSDCQP